MTDLSPQTQAADPRLNVFVTANAGSGKTSTLVQRVARLLLRGARPEALLCVTYTKAAAAEMQTRLFQTLGGWAVMDDDKLRVELARIEESPDDLAKARRLFARALETPGGLKIQTIHAFCEKLLRRFPLEAGVSPNFEVLEDAAASEVSRAARDALARHALSSPDGAIGRAYAHFAVQLDYRSFDELFSAFATRRGAIADWLRRLEADGDDPEVHVWRLCGFAHPEDVVAIEAESVGACEMTRWADAAERLALSGPADRKLGAGLAATVERARGGGARFDEVWAIFSTDKGEPLARVGTKGLDPGLRAWLEAERDRLHAGCKRVHAARIARDTVLALTLAGAYVELYEREKARLGALDFADLVAKTAALLVTREDAAWVLYKLDGGLDHVLLDEAQDTAPEQWAILSALTDEFFAGAAGPRVGLPRTVFAVGDEKQSIYSFQGAAPERLLEETQAYSKRAFDAGAPFKAVSLLQSWRSTKEVLRFVDALFADPAYRDAVPPPQGSDVVSHLPGRPSDHHGCVDLWPLELEEKPPEVDPWAPVDAEPPGSSRKRLAARIAAWIKAAAARGEAVWDKEAGLWRPMRPGDVLILVQRRDGLFEEILRALKKAGVAVAGADRLMLSDHIVFQDLLALCRFALFQDDDLSLAALLRSPFCDLDEDSLYDLAQPRGGLPLWRRLVAVAAERPAWTAAHTFLDAVHRDARTLPPFEWLVRALGRRDADGRSMRRRILTRLGREAEDALDEALAQALAQERRGVRDLERFTAALERSAIQVKRELEAAGGFVRVMTVHGAKGLEAPVVILPDTTTKTQADRSPLLQTEDGDLLFSPRKAEGCPASSTAHARRERRAQAETFRLLYVALTRARDRLIICGRLSASMKQPVKGAWYEQVALAFKRPEIAPETRVVDVGGMSVLRFGPDPLIALAAAARATGDAVLPDWAALSAPAEAPAQAYASPSDLAQRRRGPAPSPLAQAAGGVGRFRRGDLIHRLLQLLPDLPEPEREPAAERLLAKERDLAPEQRAEMAAAALAVLRDPVFAEVFGPGSRAEAAIAGSAPGLPPGLAVSGRVDRMTVTPDRVLVVDFKTNRSAPPTIDKADEAYRIQMAVYVAVLRAVFPGRRVEAALVWTDGPRLMPIPEEVIAATLASLGARA